MKNILVIGLICFFSISSGVFAQTAPKEKILDTDETILSVKSGLERVNTFSALLEQYNLLQDPKAKARVQMHYKIPDKFRMEVTLSMSEDDPIMKQTMLYDGKLLWQLENAPDGKVINAMKSDVSKETPDNAPLTKQFSLIDQFNAMLEQYDVTAAKESVLESRPVAVLHMQLKETQKAMISAKLNTDKNPAALKMIPEKMLLYWDIDKKYTSKMEIFNPDGEMITLINYQNVQINPKLDEKIFSYIPSEGVNVMDRSEMSQPRDAVPLQGKSPGFVLTDLKGTSYDSENLKGKIIILDFWADWCPPCKQELPLIENVYKKIKSKNDVQLLTITSGDKQVIADFVEKQGFTFPVLLDEQAEVIRDFKVVAIPQIFVIDAQGNIAESYQGYNADIEEMLLEDINNLRQNIKK
ncbi:MAG: redoxin domain-containing protein [Candidatus Omnitrophota bacterium]